MTPKQPEVFSEDSIDSRMLEIIYEYVLGVSNDGSDLQAPHLRSSMAYSYKFIIFAFGLLIAVGVVTNLLVLYLIVKNRMYKDDTQAFVLNNAISDLVKCLFVLPVSVYVLLVQNWVLGEVMCSFLPMIQVDVMSAFNLLESYSVEQPDFERAKVISLNIMANMITTKIKKVAKPEVPND